MNLVRKLGLVAAAALCMLPATAQASTFGGSCPDIAGTATFDKPLSNTQEDNGYHFAGTAHCDGTVNGQNVSKAPVVIKVDGLGNMSCAQGKSTGPGKGTITFTDTGVVIPFTMEFTATLSEVDLTLKGIKSGSGTGHASFANQSDPAANLTTVQNCGGSGNKALSFTANSQTDSPLDDGQSASSSQGSGSQGSSGSSSGSQSSGSSSSGSSSTSGSSQSQAPAPSSKPKPKPKHKHKSHKKPKHKKKKHKSKKHH